MQAVPNFIQNGGECGSIIRGINWDAHHLGNPPGWPMALRSTLSLVLSSRLPMLILWGPQYFCFYNDEYRQNLEKEEKVTSALGLPVAEAWPATWLINKPHFDWVTAGPKTTPYEHWQVFTNRNGKQESIYSSSSTSTIKNEAGAVEGLLVMCTETSSKTYNQNHAEQNNEWLQMALKAAEMGTWDLNLATNTIQTSELTKKLFGLPPNEEADLMLAFNNVKEQDRGRVVNAIKQAIYHGAKYNIDYTVIMQDGTERMVNSRGKLYYSASGLAIRFAGIVQDITKDVAVQRQQQQLASLVENSNDAMAIFSITGQLMYANDSFKKLVGLATDITVEQLTTQDFYSTEDYEKIVHQMRPVVDASGKWSGPATMKHMETGVPIFCHIDATRITDPFTGKMVARGVSVKDLRPEQATQKALRESRERLALSLEAADMGTFDLRIPEGTLTWDSRCRQLFGIEDDNDVTYSQTFLNGLHPDDRQTVEAEVNKALNPAGNGKYSSHYRTISPKGEFLYWVDAAGKAYFDENRKPIRLTGTVIDVTEQVNAQQEIAEREARFRLLGNVVSQLVWVAEPNRQVTYFNKSGLQYTGLTEAEMDVSSWQRLIHPDDQDAYQKQWQTLLETGKEVRMEHRIRKKDGEYRWFLSHLIPNKDGRQLFVNSSTDIQVIKENEERKNDFFQMASHELKTPVTSVKAYAQFLHKQFEKTADSKAVGMLQKMNNQISKLQVLINDLLDINRIESGKMRLNENVFYLNDLAIEVVEEMQRTTNKTLQLVTATENTAVWGDHYRIGQVLTNLLSNAIKYSPGSSQVEVKIWLEKQQVHCCVSDFGIGIPYEQQAQLFNRFYRVTGQHRDTFPGLGLGLYISSEILKRQNGTIQVKSQPQVGSDFCFSLPLYKNDEEENLRSRR